MYIHFYWIEDYLQMGTCILRILHASLNTHESHWRLHPLPSFLEQKPIVAAILGPALRTVRTSNTLNAIIYR